MSTQPDDDGQVNPAYGWNRLRDSRFDELIGICRGILADGVIVDQEAVFLRDWLERNPPVRTSDAGKELYTSLCHAFRGSSLDPRAEADLVDLIQKIIGGTPRNKTDASFSTTFPVDVPAPKVVFEKRGFCFTGKFKYGSRSVCQKAVVKIGGLIHKSPGRETSFLVIGEIGSRDWIHSSSGRKIERAVELRKDGSGISIVTEAVWCSAIKECG